MIPVIVMTSDKFMDCLPPYMHLFNKYWGMHQDCTIICFKKPNFYLPANFGIYSMGDMESYPVTKWSNVILDYLALHPNISHFILMLEDYWLTRPVNTHAVRMLVDYALQFRNVLKIDLCADRLYAAGMRDYNTCGYLDLIKSDPASQYHMSLMAGIWNRELFTRFVVPDESPWDIELRGTPRVAAAADEVLVLGTRQWPVRHTLAHRNGDHERYFLDELSTEDRNVALRLIANLSKPIGEYNGPQPLVDSRHTTP